MKRRVLKKYSKKSNLKLEPIVYDEKHSAFAIRNDIDIFATTLELHDYDRVNYKLTAWLPTKVYGDIKIDFEYCGTTRSSMTVETPKGTYKYEFDTDLFQEHTIKFLQIHIKKWYNDHNGFFKMIEESVNFYNDVLTDSNTVEKIGEIITRKEVLKRMKAKKSRVY